MCASRQIQLLTLQLDRETTYKVVPDLQGGEVREKVISNKETHKHPVINGPLSGRWRGGEVKKTRRWKGENMRTHTISRPKHW